MSELKAFLQLEADVERVCVLLFLKNVKYLRVCVLCQ